MTDPLRLMEPPRKFENFGHTWPSNDCSGNLFRYRDCSSRCWSKLYLKDTTLPLARECFVFRYPFKWLKPFSMIRSGHLKWPFMEVHIRLSRLLWAFDNILFVSDIEIISSLYHVIRIISPLRILWRNLHVVILSLLWKTNISLEINS